jgi:hypothetical protein
MRRRTVDRERSREVAEPAFEAGVAAQDELVAVERDERARES